jgi:hypothetical protein
MRWFGLLLLLSLTGCSRGPTYAEALQVYEAENRELARLVDERVALEAHKLEESRWIAARDREIAELNESIGLAPPLKFLS